MSCCILSSCVFTTIHSTGRMCVMRMSPPRSCSSVRTCRDIMVGIVQRARQWESWIVSEGWRCYRNFRRFQKSINTWEGGEISRWEISITGTIGEHSYSHGAQFTLRNFSICCVIIFFSFCQFKLNFQWNTTAQGLFNFSMSDSRSGFLFCLTNPHAIIDIFVVSFSSPQCYPQREVFFSRLSDIRARKVFFIQLTRLCWDVWMSMIPRWEVFVCFFLFHQVERLLIFDRVQVEKIFRCDNCSDLVKVRDEGWEEHQQVSICTKILQKRTVPQVVKSFINMSGWL